MLSTIDLNWSLADLNHFVCQSFPIISLNLVGFELAKVDKGKKIKKVQANSVGDLKKVVGKSRLYVVPRAEVSQVQNIVFIVLVTTNFMILSMFSEIF